MSGASQNPFGAAAPAVGYLYQCRYALHLLLQRSKDDPDAQVAVEKFDDISFEKHGTPSELIQTKHHLGTSPDLSDTSPDLWKTLRVWSDAVQKGRVTVGSTTFTVLTTASAAPGSAAELLRGTPTRKPDTAYDLLVAAAGRMTGEGLKPSRAAFLGLPEPTRRAVIRSTYVVDNAPSILDVHDDIRRSVAFAVRAEHRQAFQERLEGWWFQQIIQRLSGQTSAPITGLELARVMDDVRDSFHPDALPIDFSTAHPPDSADPEEQLYIRQLRLINLSSKRLNWARTDYYRAYSQRSKWVKDNLVVLPQLDHYDALLKEDWEREFDRLAEQSKEGEPAEAAVKRGVALYEHCHQHCRPIRPNCAEPYVGRGSYHMLVDRKAMGWHPEYRSLFESSAPAGATATEEAES